MDEADFLGKYLNLKTSENSVFQGRIVQINPKSLKLDKAFCNGIPMSNLVEVLVANIKTLEILEMPSPQPPRSTSTSAADPGYVKVERPVAVRAPTGAEVRASPRKLENGAGRKDKLRSRWVERDEQAFGSPVSTTLEPDFDFEKNLALFDKKAVYEEINASKPDLVRQIDKNNYRCNENVLQQQAVKFKQIRVLQPDNMEYVTDAGLIVPSITAQLRRRLLSIAEELGLSIARQAELMGRAATEIALHQLGGAHRLNPQNHHQCPCVAVLSGMHGTGLQAASVARQLASHGVRTILYVDNALATPLTDSPNLLEEYSLLRHSGVQITDDVEDLKIALVDLIILALADGNTTARGSASAASRWAQDNRAPVMALNPPSLGTAGVAAKCSLTPALPLCFDTSNGRIYLCNIGIPKDAFKSAGIEYLPPFGPKFVIPLHPNDSQLESGDPNYIHGDPLVEKAYKNKAKVVKSKEKGLGKTSKREIVNMKILQDSSDSSMSDGNTDELCQDDDIDDAQDVGNLCLVCAQFGRDNEKWYLCTSCGIWAHADCTGWDSANNLIKLIG